MFVPEPILTVVLGGVVLILAKQLACRSYYKEIQQPHRSLGWHCDQSDPRFEIQDAVQTANSTPPGDSYQANL